MRNKRLTILHVASLDFGRPTGPNESVVCLAHAQAADGHNVWIINVGKSALFSLNKIFGLPVPGVNEEGGGGGWREFSSPLSLLDTIFPDIVHIHGVWSPRLWMFASTLRSVSIPYIVAPRGGLVWAVFRIKRLKKMVATFLWVRSYVRNAAAIHFLNAEEACASNKLNQGNVIIVGNGSVMLGKIPAADLVSKHSDWGSCLKVIKYLGRYDIEHKGLDILLHAVLRVQDDLRRRGVVVEMRGGNYRGGREYILEFIAAHGLGDLVEVGGVLRGVEEKIDWLLDKPAIFIHTSRLEGEPQAVLEALIAGLPCVLSKGTNLSVAAEMNGFGWAAGSDVDEVALCLRKVLSSEELLPAMRSCATQYAKRCDWGVIAAQCIEKYGRLLSGDGYYKG